MNRQGTIIFPCPVIRLFEDFAQQASHLAWFGMTVGPQLRINQIPVDADLETTTIRGDQGEIADLEFKFI